ncbi:hypothetical protein BpHYR1_029323 [Brachionus plicatilis]|uniref:Uncharacterized protein n=1 Tax=Brachionus plicatilis TaxID=10195 RepID=A0A3M7REK4_BRAPC|nr:hypothetical protein BpHYR1_029323 [Brachionus plicatilis]
MEDPECHLANIFKLFFEKYICIDDLHTFLRPKINVLLKSSLEKWSVLIFSERNDNFCRNTVTRGFPVLQIPRRSLYFLFAWYFDFNILLFLYIKNEKEKKLEKYLIAKFDSQSLLLLLLLLLSSTPSGA